MSEEKDINEFLEEYVKGPIEDYTKEQLVECFQEYLVSKGYGYDQATAAVDYVTGGGQGVNYSGFLQTEGNSKFARKLANLDVAKLYSYYSTVSSYAVPVQNLYNDLSELKNHVTENGGYDAEGNKLLEDALYNYMDLTGNLADNVPGGFIFSDILNEMKPIIEDGIKTIKGKISSNSIAGFLSNSENIHYLDSGTQALIDGKWENGPTLNQLEDIYNCPSQAKL